MAGQKGTGKTTVGKLIAKVLSCESPNGFEPCNKCNSCLAADNGSHNEIYEIDGASNNGVDDIRKLKEEIKYPPANGKYKIYIIDEVHMLSTNAFNALLKTVEEPPSYVVFIFATTELHKIPATIRSRCQIHTFTRMDETIISARLEFIAEKESIKLEKEAALMIAKNSDGSMRDAISILNNVSHNDLISKDIVMESLGLIDESVTIGFVDSLMSKEIQTALALYQGILKKGKSASQLIESIILLLTLRMMNGENVLEYSLILKKILRFKRDVAHEKNVQLLFNLFIIEYSTESQQIGNVDDAVINDLNRKIDNISSEFNVKYEKIQNFINTSLDKRFNKIEEWIKKVVSSGILGNKKQHQKNGGTPPLVNDTYKEFKSIPNENVPDVFTQPSNDVVSENSKQTEEFAQCIEEESNVENVNVSSQDDIKKTSPEIEKVNDIMSRLRGFGLKTS